jgi:hypothetical protein
MRLTLRLAERERSFNSQPDPESSSNLTYFDQVLSFGAIRQRDLPVLLFILATDTASAADGDDGQINAP